MPKLYRVTLTTTVVAIMGLCLSDVLLTVAELWPNEKILSAVIAPEWD
jgi:hypothetical protein